MNNQRYLVFLYSSIRWLLNISDRRIFRIYIFTCSLKWFASFSSLLGSSMSQFLIFKSSLLLKTFFKMGEKFIIRWYSKAKLIKRDWLSFTFIFRLSESDEPNNNLAPDPPLIISLRAVIDDDDELLDAFEVSLRCDDRSHFLKLPFRFVEPTDLPPPPPPPLVVVSSTSSKNR